MIIPVGSLLLGDIQNQNICCNRKQAIVLICELALKETSAIDKESFPSNIVPDLMIQIIFHVPFMIMFLG